MPRCSLETCVPHAAKECGRGVWLSGRKPRHQRLCLKKPWLEKAGGRSWVYDQWTFPKNMRSRCAMDLALLRGAQASVCRRCHEKVEVSCLNFCHHACSPGNLRYIWSASHLVGLGVYLGVYFNNNIVQEWRCSCIWCLTLGQVYLLCCYDHCMSPRTSFANRESRHCAGCWWCC